MEASVGGVLGDTAGELILEGVLRRQGMELDVPGARDREVFGAPLLALVIDEVDRTCGTEAAHDVAGSTLGLHRPLQV